MLGVGRSEIDCVLRYFCAQGAPYSTQHTAYSIKRTAYSIQRTASICSIQHTAIQWMRWALTSRGSRKSSTGATGKSGDSNLDQEKNVTQYVEGLVGVLPMHRH